MRISHRHLDVLVTSELRHGQDVDAVHHEPTGERVPETVPREVRDASFLDCSSEPVTRALNVVNAAASGRRLDRQLVSLFFVWLVWPVWLG